MSRIRVLATVTAVVVFALTGGVLAQENTVAELIAENPDLSTFSEWAAQAGAVLTGTVYAPTNDAFAAWPAFVTDYVTNNPEFLTALISNHIAVEATELDSEHVVTADIAAADGSFTIINTVLIPSVTLPELIPADVAGDIVLAGSSTVFPISQTIAADFAAEGFAGEVTADSIGTGAGFERFCAAEGASDIANASRPIRDSEIEACEANNQREPVGFLVGNDGLAVTLNPANDYATDLTLDELVLAFSTAVTWADVRPGFPECEIVRFSPGTDSGTFDFFVEEIFDKDQAPLLAATGLNLSEDDNVLLDGVASNECAIGYFGYAYYAENTDKLTLVAVDGVLPDADTVNDGSYALARPLYIYTAANVIAEKPQIGDFMTYYLSRVPDVTPAVGYFLPTADNFNLSKLVLLALLNSAQDEM